ncbi:hypothetical protein BZG36_04504 [Bifiguratus adelaidae]|uniref:Calcium-transporting ATPase n=1 Tax=Bifiguratus adelaidae TaxID=1938954 RepID=A0A261XW21_9FUNG|nr:hypothetical protein BZG36_04504 [Bifiguratus adelaidae]
MSDHDQENRIPNNGSRHGSGNERPIIPAIITDPSALTEVSPTSQQHTERSHLSPPPQYHQSLSPSTTFDGSNQPVHDSSAISLTNSGYTDNTIVPLTPRSHTLVDTPRPSFDMSNKGDDDYVTPNNVQELAQPHNDPENPFAFSVEQLTALVDPKNLELLHALGGVKGIVAGLHADAVVGLGADERVAFDPITLDDINHYNDDLDIDTAEPKRPSIPPPGIRPKRDATSKSRKSILSVSSDHDYHFPQRKQVFGRNVLPDVKSKSLLQLMWEALQDRILILLSCAALISLTIGLIEDLRFPELNPDGTCCQPKVKWVEGVAIIVAVVIVVVVGSLNDYQKERQFRKLNAKKEDRLIKVTRSGIQSMISVFDLQVGDIAHLEPGDIIPADGVFLTGHNLKCDESAATGESDAVKKASYEDCWRYLETHGHGRQDDTRSVSATSGVSRLESPVEANGSNFHGSSQGEDSRGFLVPPSPISPGGHQHFSGDNHKGKVKDVQPAHSAHPPDPFIISGSKVLEGVATYVVTGVGVHSFNGKTMMSLRQESQSTPLQLKLDRLANSIAKLGFAAATLMLIVLVIKYGAQYPKIPQDQKPSGTMIAADIVQIVITAVTIVVVAVPEGLPLAVTLALAYATQRMLKDNNLVRVLAACETMGNATTICSDKTGTLTQNKMTVVAGTFGTSLRFVKDLPENREDLIKLDDVPHKMAPVVANMMHEAIAVNSTAFEGKDANGEITLVGSKTETALLAFSQALGADKYSDIRDRYEIVRLYPFSSEHKSMTTVIKVPIYDAKGNLVRTIYRAHIKGASELMVSKCSSILRNRDSSYNEPGALVKTRELTPQLIERTNKIINSYATRSLRTIALCWRDFEHWPPPPSSNNNDEVPIEDVFGDNELTLMGVVGIEDPLRDGVTDAVEACQRAGVFVRMVTGDNVLTAKSIASQCGIFTEGGIVMEGPVFRNMPDEERDAIIPRLQVLARSSPEDKKILVGRLKEMGDVVAVTGDGTNDGPALKMADVGFSMGIAGTEVAKEASSIILMDDNFSSIVKAIVWGRCVNDSVKKFLQFQLTVNVTAVALAFISACVSESEQSVLTAVQLLWVNLIMDTFAALALATDPPTPELLDRPPEAKTDPLISLTMWKQIIGQAIYQLVATFVLLYTDLTGLPPNSTQLHTTVFNAFVWMQIFNEFNSRRIDNRLNIFERIHKNLFFIVIFFICAGGQALIVNVGGVAFSVTRVDSVQWAIALIAGVISLPVGLILRLIPDDVVSWLIFKPSARERYIHTGVQRNPEEVPLGAVSVTQPTKVVDSEG